MPEAVEGVTGAFGVDARLALSGREQRRITDPAGWYKKDFIDYGTEFPKIIPFDDLSLAAAVLRFVWLHVNSILTNV